MYGLMITEAVLRLLVGLTFLFIIVPAMAWPRPRSLDRLQWFWWCFGFVLTCLILLGHLLSALRLFTAIPLLLAIATAIFLARARGNGLSPVAFWQKLVRNGMLLVLNILDRRINVLRRARRVMRRSRTRVLAAVDRRGAWMIAGWTAVIGVAAFFRFLRPFSTANLGYSDVFPHLYMMRLLEEGIQVHPQFGPYPRGMHFLILAVHELTNANLTLLTNCFGSLIGVLITVAVGDAARRLVGDPRAALCAAALAAATLGGPSQYFVLGGAFVTSDPEVGRTLAATPYEDVRHPGAGPNFDLLQFAFRRLTVTYPQELAVLLLLPAALFLLDWFRTRDKWLFTGFLFCATAIAAIHTLVIVPLVLMCGVSALSAAAEGRLSWADFRRAVLSGTAAVAAGSAWMLVYLIYQVQTSGASRALTDAVGFFFPYLRGLSGAGPPLADLSRRTYLHVAVTPFLTIVLIVAALLVLRALFVPRQSRGSLIWPAAVTLLFFYVHVASRFGLPEILPLKRSAQWFVLAIILLITVAVAEAGKIGGRLLPETRMRLAYSVLAILVVGLWLTRVPDVRTPEFRRAYIEPTGYGMSTYAVLRVEREFQPFSWTLVTYGQEFPMVLGSGFHISAVDFLNRYDPAQAPVPIPSRHIFIVVEKNPHTFEVTDWVGRFSRADIAQRLQTWCYLYQLHHRNIGVYLEDANVRVYVIEHNEQDLDLLAKQRS